MSRKKWWATATGPPYFETVATEPVRQTTVTISARKRGCHLITAEIEEALAGLDLRGDGLAHLFLQHTSASLSLNEDASPDVRRDLESILDRLVPEGESYYEHTSEGPDDMPAHAKSSLVGASLIIPVTGGRLALGTWQGIYLCEHRDRSRQRTIVITCIVG
jgi:secondary thiamine-phosphate synthase enzyme